MIHFLVHAKYDSVGVAAVDLKAGEKLTGLVMDTQESIEIKAAMDIPLGHKISLVEMKPGDTVIKYGYDIGQVVADIKKGQHVQIHNLKTKRW